MLTRTIMLVVSLALLMPSARATEEAAMDSIKTSAGDLQIAFIGHATLIDVRIRKMK